MEHSNKYKYWGFVVSFSSFRGCGRYWKKVRTTELVKLPGVSFDPVGKLKILSCETEVRGSIIPYRHPHFKRIKMDYAAKVWVGICGGFVLICGILLYTGGLVWTDKIEQLEIAQTRVIDMNAEPVQKDSKPKY